MIEDGVRVEEQSSCMLAGKRGRRQQDSWEYQSQKGSVSMGVREAGICIGQQAGNKPCAGELEILQIDDQRFYNAWLMCTIQRCVL